MARREAIIASAVREMNRHGVRGMTLGDVAARLDLVPTGVIYYFRNKEELAAAAFERSIGRIQALAEAARGHDTERARVESFIHLFIYLQQRIELGEAEPLTVFNDVRALNCEGVNQAYVELFRTIRSLLDRRENRSRSDLNGRTHLLFSALTFVNAWIYTWRVEDYQRIAMLAATLQPQELLGLSADEVLHRLFWEEPITRFEPLRPRFACKCSRQRVTQMLRSLGQAEVQSIIAEQTRVEVGCEFCGIKYRFDAVDAAQLFAGTFDQPPSSSLQ
jgi:AcrR family transcriptional regulator